MWHASGRGRNETRSWRIAARSLAGVGDASLGEWREVGNGGVVHIRRRLSMIEAERYGHVVRDIRGTTEEARRLAVVYAERPDLADFLRRAFR